MNRDLNRLARLYHVQTSYVGLGRQRKTASPEALLRVLAALGAPIRNMEDVPKLLKQRERQLKDEAQPVIVAWDGHVDRKRHNLRRLGLPAELPIGYHRFNEVLIISAPKKAFSPTPKKMWGVFTPVYALHSRRTSGIGDLTDLSSVVNWMSELGGKVAGTLPLLANFLQEPFEASPYSPASRLFWNELYIDPEKAVEFKATPQAQKKLSFGAAGKLVDYHSTIKHKRSILEPMAKAFFERATDRRRSEFAAFLRERPLVEDYSRFRAITDRKRCGWTQWTDQLQRRQVEADDFDEDARQYHLYAQWIIQEQLQQLSQDAKAKGVMLYLDLPLGLHLDSYDAWRFPELFVKGMCVGAPPDIVFTTGQNWSLPPMHPEAIRKNRYRYVIDYIRNHLRYASLLRIDHVMGLHRFFWIPDGMPTSEGVYVEYPAEEMYAVLSVESHLHRAGIIGENLGNVAPVVNSSMRRHNIQRMYVAQYEMSDSARRDPLGRPAGNVVASLNTHDMPPYRAFLEGTDVSDKLALKFVDSEDAAKERRSRARLKKVLLTHFHRKRGTYPDLLRDSLGFLARSSAKLVLVNLEDLWGEVLPQNIPATSRERPNWSRRLRYSVERIQKDPEITRMLRDLNETRKK